MKSFFGKCELRVDWLKSLWEKWQELRGQTEGYRLTELDWNGDSNLLIDVFGDEWIFQSRGPMPADEVTRWQRAFEASREAFGVQAWWLKTRGEEKEAPRLLAGNPKPEPFCIREGSFLFEVNPRSGYSPGLFLDQRDNRARVAERVADGDRVLNLFAYTGSFSIAAAKRGAVTTTLDLASPCLEWGKRNFRHNQLDPDAHYWIKGDAGEWLKQFAKKQRRFHGIVLDPPTFSRAGKKIWRVEEGLWELVEYSMSLLEDDGWLFVSTNCHQMTREYFSKKISSAIGRRASWDWVETPDDFSEPDALKMCWIEREASRQTRIHRALH